jgi:hypothetical protein
MRRRATGETIRSAPLGIGDSTVAREMELSNASESTRIGRSRYYAVVSAALEGKRIGQRPDSKSGAPKGVGGSSPLPSATKPL